ncbi:MAG: VWA domain-containing protein [Alphaproteobacteria bacterium]|nr:VWA domain-containing protein [Alphaproteobacteria bacterium]
MSFLFPAGFLLSALALPIAAMYFLRIRRRRVRVPSLMLWHAMQRSERLASPFDRFRKHLLLLLQLLLLAVLVLALTRPYLQTEAAAFRSIVLVVDTSASMGAVDEKPTRLGAAREKAAEILGDLGPSDEVMLIEAGPRTEVRVPFTRDEAQVENALSGLEVTEAEGGLREGLQLGLSLARSRPDVEVVVLSDGAGEDLSSLPTGGAKVTYLRIGKKDDNAGILALDLRRSPVSELDRQLFVTVEHYGNESVDATVEVYLDDELVGLRNERLTARAPVSMVFDVDGSRSGVLRVELDVPGDLLPADDTAYAVLGAVSARKVVLVGGDALTARVLRADPRVDLKLASPASATPASLAGADAILFGAAVPEGMDGLNYAVLSSKHGGPAELGDPIDLPRILGWQRTHPVLRFVDLNGVTIARAASVGNTAGLAPIVDGDAGPLILAGERQGGRVVQLAFDPFQSDLPMRVAWPVMILNTVGWLTEETAGASDALLLPAGAPYFRKITGAGDNVTVRGPKGDAGATVSDGTLRVVETDHVGVYRVKGGGVDVSFAANLLSEKESRIAPLAALSLGEDTEAAAQASVVSGRRELWRPLLAIGLFLLLLEWLAWNRRATA